MKKGSLTAPTPYEPVRPGKGLTADGLTAAQAKAVLARVGVVLTTRSDSYAVRLSIQKADEAYETDELEDAFQTGLMMVDG